MGRLRAFFILVVIMGCGTTPSSGVEPGVDGGVAPLLDASLLEASPPDASTPATCVAADQLRTWQQEIDLFDGGYRPTGSPAHEGYIRLLATELAALGVEDVHTEAYGFTKWTPSAWSLALSNGPSAGPIPLTGYVPYSGSTGPGGVSAGIVYVPMQDISLSPDALQSALADPSGSTQALSAEFRARLTAATGGLLGKIVVFDAPRVSLSLRKLTGQTLFVNDPGNTVSIDAAITRTDLSLMLLMPAMLDALAASGAVGAVGILDVAEEAARGIYAPFFGASSSPHLPAVYVDRATGATLKNALTATGPFGAATLVVDAALAQATSENLVGVLPGASDKEILLGSHTDGPNSMEDNGPAALLALASCLGKVPQAQRPRTIRFVLSGGHFIGSQGLTSYVDAHRAELTTKALALMELEHLGAREWTEVSAGVMGLTGQPAVQTITTSSNKPLVDASVAFAKHFPRSIVGTPPLLGEGQNFRVVPLIQFLTMPEYLLVGHLPTITSQLTDYDLMQRQVDAFAEMEKALAQDL